MQNPGQWEPTAFWWTLMPLFLSPQEFQRNSFPIMLLVECLVHMAHSFSQPAWHKVTISPISWKLSLKTNFQPSCCHPLEELEFVVLLNYRRRLQTSENHFLSHSPHSDTHYCWLSHFDSSYHCTYDGRDTYKPNIHMAVMVDLYGMLHTMFYPGSILCFTQDSNSQYLSSKSHLLWFTFTLFGHSH
jgi:hypothetical protein